MYVNNWVNYIKMQEQLRMQKLQCEEELYAFMLFDTITVWGVWGVEWGELAAKENINFKVQYANKVKDSEPWLDVSSDYINSSLDIMFGLGLLMTIIQLESVVYYFILLHSFFISLKLSSPITCKGDLVISTSTEDMKDCFEEVGVLKDQHLSTVYVWYPLGVLCL